MATVHRRALGTLLLVTVLLAACQPVTRPEPSPPAAAPAATPVFSAQDIPTLIAQLDDPNWIVANQAAEALAGLGEVSTAKLREKFGDAGDRLVGSLDSRDWLSVTLILRTLEKSPIAGVRVLSETLMSQRRMSPQFRSLSALGLSRMGQPGRDALVAAIEGKQVIAFGAAPLLGEEALPALRSLVDDSSAVTDTQRAILATLVAMGDKALPDQVAFFNESPGLQSDFIANMLHGAAANPLLRHIAASAYPDDIRTAAVAALGGTPIDPAATVPLLIGLLEDTQQPLDLRRAALRSLGNYGTQAAAIIPLLEELLATPADPLQAPAVLTLGQIAPGWGEVMAQLAAQLAQCDRAANGLAAAAAQSLGEMGPLAQSATGTLLGVFKTCKDEEVLAAAATALGQVAPSTPAVIDALSAQLTITATNNAITLTEATVTALGQLGPAALPALAAALAELPAEAKSRIATTLAHMGPVAAPVLIGTLLQPNADADTQQAAASGLIGIGSRALPFMIEALSNDENAERQRLVDALYPFGAQALPALQFARTKGLSVDSTKLTPTWCATADNTSGADLPSSCISAADVLPALVVAIQPSAVQSATLPVNQREGLIQVLGAFGPSAAAAAPLLGQVLTENDVRLQCAAAQALQKIGASGAIAGPAIAQALAQVDATVSCGEVFLSEQLIDTLGSLGPNAEFAIPQLMASLAGPKLRRHAAETLGAIGGAAHAPLLVLLRGAEMDNESVDRRRAAAYALHQSSTAWGPTLAAQVTVLAQNTSENRYVRAMLAAGLAEQGYPLDGIWTQLDLPNLSTQVCWTWPAIETSGAVFVIGYDLYGDTCLLGPTPKAPLLEDFANALVAFFRR